MESRIMFKIVYDVYCSIEHLMSSKPFFIYSYFSFFKQLILPCLHNLVLFSKKGCLQITRQLISKCVDETKENKAKAN